MSDKVLIYGADWCWDCRRARKFLTRREVPFEWIDVDKDHEAELFVLRTNRGTRSIPTIVFPDGSILVEPSNEQLAHKLGLA
jgi:glutaredoxin